MPQYVEIELDNKTRRLKYDFNAIADLEEKAKASIFTLLSEERIGFNSYRLFIWAGLKHEEKSLTIEGVGGMLQRYAQAGNAIPGLFELILKALKVSGVWVEAEATEDPEGNGQTGAVN